MYSGTVPSLTRGEYWLLESVVTYAVDVSLLASPHLNEALNKTGHGLTVAALAATLNGLFDNGLIVAFPEAGWDEVYVPSPDEIDRALTTPGSAEMAYRLTSAGGAVWEAFAAPDWRRYVHLSLSTPIRKREVRCEIQCADRSWLDRYLGVLRTYILEIDERTLSWDQRAPWQATYWKELISGNRVRFRARYRESDLMSIPASDFLVHQSTWYRWH